MTRLDLEREEPRARPVEWPLGSHPFEIFRPPKEVLEAVRGWVELSNGRVEMEGFRFDHPLTAPSLNELPLECLQHAHQAHLWEVNPSRCFQILFQAASQGGAYGGAQFGAYGRLAALTSLAALLDCDLTGPSLSASVGRARLFAFDSDGPLFERLRWELGLAVLQPGHRDLVVVAATDND